MTRLALSRATVDRAAELRRDPAALAAAWADPQTRVLVVDDGRAPVAGDPPALVLVDPADAPEGDRLFLGVEAGTTYFAVAAPLPAYADGQAATLREVGAVLDDRDAGLLTHAVALANWHAAHRRCARCGAPTEVADAGHVRRCPADGSSHFPRVDPAVIMLVVDGDGRGVLGRGVGWPERRHSVLAGFVEPGESLEQAVAREVAEEVGLAVTDVRYVGSQPWPFPSSLMLGFTARAAHAPLRVDPVELTGAGWFTPVQVRASVADGSLLLPPPVSIARRLIEGWLAGELPAPD